MAMLPPKKPAAPMGPLQIANLMAAAAQKKAQKKSMPEPADEDMQGNPAPKGPQVGVIKAKAKAANQ